MKEFLINGKRFKLKDDFTADEIIKTDAITQDSIYDIMKNKKHAELLETVLIPIDHNEPEYDKAGITLVAEVVQSFFSFTQIELTKNMLQSLKNSCD